MAHNVQSSESESPISIAAWHESMSEKTHTVIVIIVIVSFFYSILVAHLCMMTLRIGDWLSTGRFRRPHVSCVGIAVQRLDSRVCWSNG